ncbi:5-formyltetrahydrofolate cyclo-ligase [Macrococcus equi]|uniref:5-formyltetrahydrofolate cyclo-ligase n=1 Tax=Macrococcus equi TaxID=3395462 RepID=UPI0039BE121A
MTLKDAKKKKRLSMLEKLKNNQQKYEKENKIIEHLLHHPIFLNANSIGITLSMAHELDTRFIIRYAQILGKTVYVPLCDYQSKQMSFVRYTCPEDLTKDSYGIDIMDHQIDLGTHPEVLIVPGVVFNTQGYRIGYGGGYYDKFLSNYDGQTMSLIFELQLDEVITEEHDIAVDWIITEDRIIEAEVKA